MHFTENSQELENLSDYLKHINFWNSNTKMEVKIEKKNRRLFRMSIETRDLLSRHSTALIDLAQAENLLLDVDSCIKHSGNDCSDLVPSCEEGTVLTRQMGL